MHKSIYTKRLLTDDSYRSCVRCTDADYVYAGIVGGMTTDELRQYFVGLPFHPEAIVVGMKRLRARWAGAVEHADFLRSCARLPRHLKLIPNVEVERQWLSIADELVDRAEVAIEFWRLAGGERALEIKADSQNKSAPLDVRVVSMIDRERLTEIERDANCEIVSMKQIERDVA